MVVEFVRRGVPKCFTFVFSVQSSSVDAIQSNPCHTVQSVPCKTRPDSYPIDLNGDIVRCGGNGRVEKKRTLLFPPFHYIYCYLRFTQTRTVGKSQLEDSDGRHLNKMLVSEIACGLGGGGLNKSSG